MTVLTAGTHTLLGHVDTDRQNRLHHGDIHCDTDRQPGFALR